MIVHQFAMRLLIMLLLHIIQGVTGNRVLFINAPAYSHIMDAVAVAEKLTAYGHETYILKPREIPIRINETVHVIEYAARLDEVKTADHQNFLTDCFRGHVGQYEMSRMTLVTVNIMCLKILHNQELMDKIKKMNFDYAVIDSSFFYCFYSIPKQLGIRFSVQVPFEAFLNREYAGTALDFYTNAYIEEHLNNKKFIHRVMSVLINLRLNRILKDVYAYHKYNLRYPTQSLKEYANIEKQADVLLLMKSIIFTNFRCKSPNTFVLGGILSKKDVISNEIFSYVKNAKSGIVVVSFGTALHFTDEHILKQMLAVFGQFNQFTFIWKADMNTTNLKIPDNVKMFKWIPQHSLLAYAKLLITHGGIHSIQEATFSGVPMIVIPVIYDQIGNGRLVAEKELGVVVKLKEFTQLQTAMHRILFEGYMKNTTKRASMIMQNLEPDPASHAAFILNHVIKYGSKHLKFDPKNLNGFQLRLYDIMIFILVYFMLICTVIFIFCLLILSLIFPSLRAKWDHH